MKKTYKFSCLAASYLFISTFVCAPGFAEDESALETYLGQNSDIEVVDESTKQDEFSYKMAVHTKIKGLEERIAELKKTNDELRDKLKKLDYYELELTKAKDENRKLQDELVKAQFIVLKARIGEGDHPVTYEVREGDSLWRIAGKKKIYNNPYKWLEIYDANKEKIEDPDAIYPGQVLFIPRY